MSGLKIPNFEDPAAKLPFAESEASIPKATSENFICLVGPCRHYHELTSLMLTAAPAEHRKIHRYCTRFLDEAGATFYLTEQTVKSCTAYRPPIWSLAGWRRMFESFQWMVYVYQKKSPGITAWPKSLALTVFVAVQRLVKKARKNG